MEKISEGRGPAFEDDVQTMIDRTRWKPSPEIRAWKGKKVKIGSEIITDIDAIGCYQDRLLLIECKSIYYGLAHGSAARGEVRNAREKVEQAVRKSSSTDLAGATNLDLKNFKERTRIVVTPAPVYVAAPYAETSPNGFPLSISYWELYHLLYGAKQRDQIHSLVAGSESIGLPPVQP
jgi:hypothetical protein